MEWTDPPPPGPGPLPDLHPLVGTTLHRRGITKPEQAQAFLNPRLYAPTSPTEMPGIAAAAERVIKALEQSESVCVWGDFDVDGQTSTTILVQTLRDLGAKVTYHIPVRENEGHGVNLAKLKEELDHGAGLILTCDTGISAHEAVDYARTRGVDVVITDHHELPETLPNACAVVNPKLLPENHALATLSGSGTAYVLAEELYNRFNLKGAAVRHLDLAALGLVADLAPLKGEARYLVQCGLESLRSTHRLGLQILMETAELNPANVTEEHIGFVIGPRLNALGRLGDANPIVELFTTKDPSRARLLSTQLEGLNTQRQLLCNQVTQAAEAQLQADPALLEEPVIVLGQATWPGGIIGIVASRLVERYHKPAILFSTPPGEPARGSARSVDGLDITAAIAKQRDLLLGFGGHKMAAGLALEAENLPVFRRRLWRTVEKTRYLKDRQPRLELDAWLELPEVNLELASALEVLAPYGPGNEKLVLATRDLGRTSATLVGRNQEHVKLTVADRAGNEQTIFWWNGDAGALPDGRFDLAYTVRATDWRGKRQAQVEFMDIRPVHVTTIEVQEIRREVVDLRQAAAPEQALADIQRQPETIVWAEGKEKKRLQARDRNELIRAKNLVIWTPPASREELQQALEKVEPERIYLFAEHIPIETAETFLELLAGVLKFVIRQMQGKVTWSQLAASTSQRGATLRSGINWLVSQGKFNIYATEDGIIVSVGTSMKDPVGGARLWSEIQELLGETAAYRAHFKRADKDTLFD